MSQYAEYGNVLRKTQRLSLGSAKNYAAGQMADMSETKFLAVLAVFENGATLRRALDANVMSTREFYRLMQSRPDLRVLYYNAQKDRADVLVNRVDDMLDNPVIGDVVLDPRTIRAIADGKLRLAALYDAQRFGDRVQIDVTQKVDLTAAIAAARARALAPVRDLAHAVDAEYTALPALSDQRATDKQSVSAQVRPAQATYADVFGPDE